MYSNEEHKKLERTGVLIKQRLCEIDMPQKELALNLGIRPYVLYAITSGRRKAPELLVRISELIDLNLEIPESAEDAITVSRHGIHCPKCGAQGQSEELLEDGSIRMVCECGKKWKAASHICPVCGQLNGYAVPGLCIECYSDRLEAKNTRRAARGMNVWWMGVGA